MAKILSSHKAKIMLEEGTANKQPLTSRQKRYFGWIAGGRKKPKKGHISSMRGKK